VNVIEKMKLFKDIISTRTINFSPSVSLIFQWYRCSKQQWGKTLGQVGHYYNLCIIEIWGNIGIEMKFHFRWCSGIYKTSYSFSVFDLFNFLSRGDLSFGALFPPEIFREILSTALSPVFLFGAASFTAASFCFILSVDAVNIAPA